MWLCEKNGAFVFVSFWFWNDPVLAFFPFLLLKSKSKSCSSDGKVTGVWPFLTLTRWDGCFSPGLNQINPYVYIFFYLFFFFSLLPAPKINVASGSTFCFSPEKKKEQILTLVFRGPSDTVFYFLTALCKLLVGNSLLNLHLGLCVLEVVIISAS